MRAGWVGWVGGVGWAGVGWVGVGWGWGGGAMPMLLAGSRSRGRACHPQKKKQPGWGSSKGNLKGSQGVLHPHGAACAPHPPHTHSPHPTPPLPTPPHPTPPPPPTPPPHFPPSHTASTPPPPVLPTPPCTAGGAVQNPIRALAQLLASFHLPNGSVAVRGFYDDVQPITDMNR